ncbi:hypothetical protein [Methanococcus voltae]|uniref:Uncharacterized protein n=1 Tax=Methanococcus voltae (strain ATCC BAA-1334 / A3) TaxID=456320 RepID=D7DRB9_METV3|nr:hypothetical protein [Methanococcus voltae]MCS3901056.1 hypothetical protein [Methanococcus voltae]
MIKSQFLSVQSVISVPNIESVSQPLPNILYIDENTKFYYYLVDGILYSPQKEIKESIESKIRKAMIIGGEL